MTKATIKSFIRKAIKIDNLYAKTKSYFNGMIDCVESVNDNFTKLNVSGYDEKNKSSLGLDKVWFVNGSRDYFSKYEDSNFIGYEVYNSCGSYIVAVPK